MSVGLFERGQLALQSQRFSSILGARLTTLYPGKACLELPVDENHEQQHGFVHGGVISYLADNTLTFAAGSILGDCVTSEFKLNYVRPAVGSSLLIAEAEVIASGKSQAVCRCEVYFVKDGQRKLCAAAQGTIRRIE